METKTVQQEFIYRSNSPDIKIPNHLPLHKYIFENISKFSSNPCLINSNTGEIFTYDDVHLLTRKVASGLTKIGIKKGDVIMLLLQNSPEFIFSFLGASYCGAISTTANPLYTPIEIAKQAKGSRAKLIITHASFIEKVKDFADENGVKIVCTDGLPEGCVPGSINGDEKAIRQIKDSESANGCIDFSQLTGAYENDMPEVELEPDDVVALPYSSGTTGLPKGVMLTHKNLVSNVGNLVDGESPTMHFHNKDVIMCVLPLFHIYSLSSVFLCGLRVGATLVIMKKFELNACMELIEKYKVTITPFVPPILLAMVKTPLVDNYDLSSIRMVQSGGAPLGKEVEDAIKAKLPNAVLGQGCGMTEGGPVAMCPAFAKEPSESKPGSCGKVIRNCELKIVDVESGASLPRNQAGELCFRGDQVMKGYLNDPENTARIIDEDGWLHSGDIGYIDDDDEIYIVDRLKELIKYKGFQVPPAELEAILVAHPSISEAVVVPMKDEAAGEVPVAFVVKANDSQISEEDIKAYIAEQVVFYKRIKRVFFIDSIPKAPSGKLLRKEVRTKLLTSIS